jgi:uncharacterized repeat protein (TIGR01451 family)
VDYTFTVVNATAVTQSLTINYASVWPYAGPATTDVLAPGGSQNFVVTVHVPNTAVVGDADVLTVTVSDGSDSDQATVTTTASLVEGYTDFANVPATDGHRTRNHSVVYYGGKLYRIGGYGGATGAARAFVDIYDIATDTWTSGADMPGARYWIDCVEIGGDIYCAGGYSTSAQSTLYIYDVATNTWSTGTTLPAARYGYAGVAVGGKYYVIGGYSGSAYVNTIYAYDPVANTWDSTLPNMTAARRDGAAGVIGGKIYVTGGRSAASTYVNTTEVYDPALNTWGTAASLPATGWVLAADAVKNDRYLFLLGGSTADATASSYALAYDAVNNSWSQLPALDHLLYGAEADTDGDGNVWAASGRLYENAVFSYSPYTFKVDVCSAANADLTCAKSDLEDPVNYGMPITYTINVTNTGNADGWNTVVTDTLPAGVTFVSASPECSESLGIVTCELGSLRNGTSDALEIAVTAPSATVLLTNVVEVASDEDDLDLSNNVASETTQVTNASISLAKTVGTDPLTCAATDTLNVLSGAEVTYCYTVLNTGSVTFTEHSLVDSELGTLLTAFPYSLAPGATAFITETAVITEATTNDATWTSTNGILTVNASDSATVNIVSASITLEKTVGTDPAVCATTGSIVVAPNTDVTYCYEVTNTSPGTLSYHDLVDGELGTILNTFPYSLAPGSSAFITATANITQTTVNTATWTAYNAGPIHVASANDTATVTVVPPEPLVCNGAPVAFESGIPFDWTVVDNTGGPGIDWTTTASPACGPANLTNGSGEAACADRDIGGSATQPYDTELISNPFDLTGFNTINLSAAGYFRNLAAGGDLFRVDVWNGSVWTNVLTWDENHQPGDISLNLSAYAGLSDVQVRFRYSGTTWDWYAQVDDVALNCSTAVPDIELTKTVGTEPGVCAATSEISVDSGETVYYCYEVTNTGDAALPLHTLVDSELGTLFTGLAYDLQPGASVDTVAAGLTITDTIILTTTNTATWTAYDGATFSASDVATATVNARLSQIAIAPASLSAVQGPDVQTTLPLTISNSGAAPLDWDIYEGAAATRDIGTAWETMAPMPSARAFNAVIADNNGYVYVIGGTSDAGALTPTNTIFRYNTATNTWDTMAAVPTTLDSIDGAVIGNKIYIPGDELSSTTYVYDIATNTWSTIAANGGYTARSQYQVVVIGTDLYVLGGIAAGASTTQVWILDTTTGTWTAGVPMQKSRTSFAAGEVNGNIYVAGGVLYPGFTPDMTAEIFNGTSWSYVANVPNGGGAYTRWSYNADGQTSYGLWLAAGRRDASWLVLNHAGYHDAATDSWVVPPTIPAMAVGRVYMEGDVASDGYFYVIGGRNGAADTAYATNERLLVEEPISACDAPTDLPWASVDPASGTTAVGGSSTVDVTFDSTGLTAGTYSGALCVTSNDPDMPLVEVPVELTVEDDYGVALSSDMALSGEPGATVTYTLTVTNLGTASDTFDVTVDGVWTANADATITLAAGASGDLVVTVQIPSDAADDAEDVTTVTVTSQAEPAATASADLTTTAQISMTYLYLPVIVKP